MPVHVLGRTFTSLAEAHAWLRDAQPTDSEVVLTCDGIIRQRAELTWTYHRPGQAVVIRGGHFTGRTDSDKNTPGWWLRYRPPAAAGDSTPAAPVTRAFRVEGCAVTGYEAGAVEVSPAVDGDPYASGNTTWTTGVAVTNLSARRLGSYWTRKAYPYSAGRFGVAGVLMRGVVAPVVYGCTFYELRNRDLTDLPQGPYLIHAVYLRDGTTGAVVDSCSATYVTGDPFRFSNGSNGNTVARCSADCAGERAMVSEWYSVPNGQTPSRDQTLNGNRPGRLANGKPLPLWWQL